MQILTSILTRLPQKFEDVYRYGRDYKIPKQIKSIAAFNESFGILDIRVGRVSEVELETRPPKQTYKMLKLH